MFCVATPCAASEPAGPLPQLVADAVQFHCLECHDGNEAAGGLNFSALLEAKIDRATTDRWELALRRLQARQMPPASANDRPDEAEYRRLTATLAGWLDRLAAEAPAPGATATLRRLTRTEYQNSVRDLLDLQIEAAELFPPDPSSHGFDNITVGELSPTLLNRYLSAAQRTSRLAVGATQTGTEVATYRTKPDRTQEKHVPGLPLGTRGGTVIAHHFPRDGVYEIQVLLSRDRNEEVEGLHEAHQIEFLLDRRLVADFTVKPPPGRRNFQVVDAHLKRRISVRSGRHDLGVTFRQKTWSLLETKRQPYDAHFNMHRHPRVSPAVFQVTVTGPFEPGAVSVTSSRRRIFADRLDEQGRLVGPYDEQSAREILGGIARRAYRRTVDADDLQVPLRFFTDAFQSSTTDGRSPEQCFQAGIEAGLAAILANPNFFFRIETVPAGVAEGEVYSVAPFELATRLSYFLWSSLPDDALLDAAASGELSQADGLRRQVLRMLHDPKASALATNFASQWLQLRNLASAAPDLRQFPDFDDNLRESMRRETELLFESIVRDDRSVVDLLNADYTYLNERLAQHYEIPHIYGNRFRRVSLDEMEERGVAVARGGLLRQASILTLTSYATRTSPVIRGHWILDKLLGSPPPPPPAEVPALEDNTVDASLPIRQRLQAHRDNPNCAGCHSMMDPLGFALENYDAVGRWRAVDGEHVIDASASWGEAGRFEGVKGLEGLLSQRPELFVRTLSEKLLTFALGRGIEHSDAPAVRAIVRRAARDDFRFSTVILSIVESPAFLQRVAP